MGMSPICVDVIMEPSGCSTEMGSESGWMFCSGALTEKKLSVVPVSRTAWVEGREEPSIASEYSLMSLLVLMQFISQLVLLGVPPLQ